MQCALVITFKEMIFLSSLGSFKSKKKFYLSNFPFTVYEGLAHSILHCWRQMCQNCDIVNENFEEVQPISSFPNTHLKTFTPRHTARKKGVIFFSNYTNRDWDVNYSTLSFNICNVFT